MTDSKERLDVLLVKQEIAESRTRAKNMITEGSIFVDGRQVKKPGACFTENNKIEFRGEKMKYVSRGGYKLEKAIEVWNINLAGKVCIDIGASTGGFTDCMLQNGAARVYAVDAGTDQLSEKLRENKRVVSMEQTNIRDLESENLKEKADFASIDVSFISLSKVLGPVSSLLKPGALVVSLIKPQFEAGRGRVGKKGVVRAPEIHRQVIYDVEDNAVKNGFSVLGTDYSPIKGPEGNIEYLLMLKYGEVSAISDSESMRKQQIQNVVREAHSEFASAEAAGCPKTNGFFCHSRQISKSDSDTLSLRDRSSRH